MSCNEFAVHELSTARNSSAEQSNLRYQAIRQSWNLCCPCDLWPSLLRIRTEQPTGPSSSLVNRQSQVSKVGADAHVNMYSVRDTQGAEASITVFLPRMVKHVYQKLGYPWAWNFVLTDVVMRHLCRYHALIGSGKSVYYYDIIPQKIGKVGNYPMDWCTYVNGR